MLEEILEDQTDWLSPPAPLRNRSMVDTSPGDAATPPQMPATKPPDTGNHSQPAEGAPESECPLTLLSPSPPPSPPPQYRDPITPASLRSEAGYEDTITLAPLPEVNIASSKPANVGLPVQVGNKISRAFSARTDHEPQSYKEAMDSTKWHVAIKSQLDSHIENGTREAGERPSGRREISSKWIFKTEVNDGGSLCNNTRLHIRGLE